MLLKWLSDLRTFFADLMRSLMPSIANTHLDTPTEKQKTQHKLFIPTFESRSSVAFWLFLIVFFGLYGLAVRADAIFNANQAFTLFVAYILTNACVVLFNVGYIHITADTLQKLSFQEILKRCVLVTLITAPFATLVANFLQLVLLDIPFVWVDVFKYMVFNTVASMMIFGLLIFYFANQQKKIEQQYTEYQQALLEQNEQLKARITPHFFFNMLNTAQYLIETDPYEAEAMIRHVSSLYRMSFGEVKEIALLDEMAICKHYLNVEKYRFEDKLQVAWHLPDDEDMLYDMTIVSLFLQLVLEKMIIFVVEMTTETIYMDITVNWSNDLVTIDIQVTLPKIHYATIRENITKKLSFTNQINVLKQHYGESSVIDYFYDGKYLLIKIQYPLKDVAV
ncbi:histidine kinase [Moraxella boevrei]|uniref:histidine kinase n=1 Tax=Faucicola boevrei TaxID=346665 RepID=UPI0037364448